MSLSINGGTFVVVWSPHRKSFHIETVNEMLRSNARIYADQLDADYIVLAFAKDFKEADATLQRIKEASPWESSFDEDE